MKDQAQVVIIGGGILGCSIAYHLTHMGWNDVVIIEKGELTSGCTWHAAGLVGQLRSTLNATRLMQESVKLYQQIEKETGQGSSWRGVGSLRLACSKERMMELKRTATMAQSYGLDMELISPKEALELFPIMSIEGVQGAAYMKTDGYADPTTLTNTLAKGARDRGCEINLHTRVTGVTVKGRRATSVQTDKGSIACEILVNAAGIWGYELGQMCGVFVPISAMQHQYLVTEDIPGMPDNLPTMRDPDHLIYYKQEVKGLAIGGFETNPKTWGYEGIPKNFDQQLLESDFDQFECHSISAVKRTPVVGEVGIRQLINGPIPTSPDGHYIMGPAPELDNCFVATGFTYGIAAGGGAGLMMAEWIVEGAPRFDLWGEDIRRFGGPHKSRKYIYDRAQEDYGKYYLIHWPTDEPETARPLRRSPIYRILKDQGAVYGSKFGWERPNWFAPEGVEPINEQTWGRPNSHEHVGNEHRAVRERVALFDQSSFGKFEVRGPGACDFLQRLSVNNVNRPIGRLIYTQWCNERGGIESDLTIGRLAEDRFYIVTGSAMPTHDMDWMQRNLPADGSVIAHDVTSSRGVVNISGPMARKVLMKVCEDDIGNENFKFGHCREIHVGYAPALALRITYVGELGWELHIPSEYVAYVYETLWEAGREFGVVNAGYLAIDSLRLEKGYRYWGADITAEYNPFEAGLEFCIAWKRGGDFIGREALEKVRDEGPQRILCGFTLEKETQLFGSETISRNGAILGYTTSGGFGHTVGKTIAYGYLPVEHARENDFTIEAFGERIAAKRIDGGALYDPERKKILM